MNLKIFCVAFLAVFATCDPPAKFIYVDNRLDDTVYVLSSCTDSIRLIQKLDSFLPAYSYSTSVQKIPPFKKEVVDVLYTLDVITTTFTDGTLKMFFLSDSVMTNYSWDEINKGQMYFKKVALTADELEKNDWTYTLENK